MPGDKLKTKLPQIPFKTFLADGSKPSLDPRLINAEPAVEMFNGYLQSLLPQNGEQLNILMVY